MADIKISLPPVAPSTLPPETWAAVNDLYVQLFVLVDQLNKQLRSPDGSLWHLTVANDGTLTAVKD